MMHLWNSCCVVAVLMTCLPLNFGLPMTHSSFFFGPRQVLLSLLVSGSSLGNVFSQEDPSADILLAKISEKMQGYEAVHAEYESKMIDRQSDFEMVQTGEVWVQGERYHLELGEYTIICDGQTVWTYEPEMGECYVDDAETIAEDGIDPARMFTIWEEGFKKVLKGPQRLGDVTLTRVDLYPTGSEEQGYHTIQCFIDESALELVQLLVKGRDGTDVEYTILKMEGNGDAPKDGFTFELGNYPGATLIDNRF